MADIEFDLSIAGDEGIKRIGELAEQLTKSKDATLAAKKEMQAYFQESANSAQEFKAEYEKVLKAYTDQKRLVTEITKRYEELRRSEQSFANSGGTEKQKQRVKELSDEVDRLKKQFDNIDVSKAVSKIAEFNTQLAKIKENAKLGIKIEDADISKLAESANFIRENYNKLQTDLSGSAGLLKTQISETTANIEYMEAAIKETQEQFDNLAPGKAKAGLSVELTGMKQALEGDIASLQEFKTQLDVVEGASNGLATSVQQSSKMMDMLDKANKSVVATIAVDLVKSLDLAKQKLATLTAGSADYGKLEAEIKAAEIAIGRLTVKVDENGNAAGGAEAELRAYKQAMTQLKNAGLDTTEVYSNLGNDAKKFQQSVDDVNRELKDTSGVDQMVRGVTVATNAFGILEGVMALTGDENQDLQRTLVKLNAIMLITNSIQQVTEELKRKDNIVTGVQIGLQKAYAIVVGNTTGALKAFRIAAAATGVGLLVFAIAELIKVFKDLGEEADRFKKIQEASSEVSVEATSGYLKQQIQLEILTDRVNKSGKSLAEKKDILKTYNEQFGETIGKAATYSEAENKIIKTGPEFIKSLRLRAFEMASFGLAVESAKKQMEIATKAPEEYLTGVEKAAKAVNDIVAKVPGSLGKMARDENAKLIKAGKDRQFAELVGEVKHGKTMIELNKSYGEKRIESMDGANYQLEKGQKKTNKNVVDDAKKTAERLIKLQQDLAAAKIAIMDDGLSKERAKLKNDYDNRIADLNTQAKGANVEEVRAIDKLILAETESYLAKDTALIAKHAEDVDAIYKEVGDEINSIVKSDHDKEIAETEKHYNELLKKVADAKKKQVELNRNLPADQQKDTSIFDEQTLFLTEELNNKKLEINQNYAIKKLDQEQALALATNELLTVQGLSEEALERLKEQNKLNILIEFANKRIAILGQMATDESKVQLLGQQKVVQDSEKGLKDLESKSKGKTLFQSLGLSKEQTDGFISTVDKVGKGARYVSRALGSIAEMYDANIRKREENIRSIENEISEQEDKVEHEKELMDQGYANNYELEQKKLEDLNARKAEEQRMLEEEQRKKAAIQKAQLIADTIAQTSNLITAASEIFAANSGVPFVGVAIALAAVATMIAGFAAIKSQAKSATQTAETGRRVAKGKRHSGGGNKYVSMDGNDQDILEIEEGEWVVNRRSSEKYDPLLEAINNGTKVNLPRIAIKRMLAPMGIHLEDDVPRQIVAQVNAANSSSPVVVVSDDSKKWEEQNRILRKIADKEASVEYTDEFKIVRKGNLVRKIKIKK